MLEMKEECLVCAAKLLNDSLAYICSFECTYCQSCAEDHNRVCKNCGGELKDKAKKSKAATKAPRKQLDLGRITPDALMEQRSLLERRVLDWLKDIPIGGAEERRELPSSRAVFPSSPP